MINEKKPPEVLKFPIPTYPENGFSLWNTAENPIKDSTEGTSMESSGIENYVGMKNVE